MMRLMVLMGLLMLALSAHAAETTNMKPVAKAYYRCMVKAVETYAKKASDASEAIDAALSRCERSREALRVDLSAEILADDIMAGRTANEEAAKRIANSALDRIDQRIRPDLVRAVLEAK